MIPLSLNRKVVCITASDRPSETGSLGISCKAGSLGRPARLGHMVVSLTLKQPAKRTIQ